jgi:hypothetical protein
MQAKERKRASARAAKAAKKDATKKDRKGRIRKAAAKQNAKSSSDVDRVKGKEHTKSELIVGLAATAASLQKTEETDDPVQKPSLSGGIAAMAAVAAASRSGNPKHHDGEDFNDGVAAMAAAAPSSQKGEPDDTGEEPKEGITAMAVPKTLPDNGGERLQAYAGEDNMGETTSESGVVEPPSDGSPIGLVNKIAETNVIATDKSVDSDQKYDNSEAEFVEVSNVPAPEPATENNDAVNMKREILQLPASSSLKSTGFEQKTPIAQIYQRREIKLKSQMATKRRESRSFQLRCPRIRQIWSTRKKMVTSKTLITRMNHSKKTKLKSMARTSRWRT